MEPELSSSDLAATEVQPTGLLRPFVFLDLPPEIRNRIYELLFRKYRVLIRGTRPGRDAHQAKQLHKHVGPKPAYRLHCSFEAVVAYQPSRRCLTSLTALELMRTCRIVHNDVIAMLYSRTTLRFQSLKTLTRFLHNAPDGGLRNIRHLEIVHTTYGEPEERVHRRWKQQHDAKWLRLCVDIGTKCTALQSLDVDLRICDWPTQLDLRSRWTTPLLAIKGAGLDRVRVHLRSRGFTEPRLQAFSRKLEWEMMNTSGRERQAKQSDRELAKQLAEFNVCEKMRARPPVTPKAAKCLRIVNIPTSAPGKLSDRSMLPPTASFRPAAVTLEA